MIWKSKLKGTITTTHNCIIRNYAAITWLQFCFTENVIIALTESLRGSGGVVNTNSQFTDWCRDETKSLESLIKSCKTSLSASRWNNYIPWNTTTMCSFLLWTLKLTRIAQKRALFIKQWAPYVHPCPHFPSSRPVMRAVQSCHSILTTCWLL